MNTKRLEAFLAIVRSGSFAAASEQLSMTQGAVSLRIRELESELGVAVFDRSRRHVALTAAGRSLVPYAEAVIASVNALRSAFGGAEAMAGTVRLGVTELVAVTWLPRLVDALQTRFPRLTLDMEVGLAGPLIERTLSGVVDVALTPGTSFPSDLDAVSLGTVEMCWMAAPRLLAAGWRWDDPGPAAPPVLLLAEHSFINSLADAWFRARQIAPRRIDTCNSMNVLAALTAAGLGVTLLPTFPFGPELESGALAIVEPETCIRATFFAAYRRNDLNPTAQIVAGIAREASTFPQAGSPKDARAR